MLYYRYELIRLVVTSLASIHHAGLVVEITIPYSLPLFFRRAETRTALMYRNETYIAYRGQQWFRRGYEYRHFARVVPLKTNLNINAA